MTKNELRTACRAAGIHYGKMNNEQMRQALADLQKVRADERNGVRRPRKPDSILGRIWATCDDLLKADYVPTVREIRELLLPQGFEKVTIQIQYYRWRKYIGE